MNINFKNILAGVGGMCVLMIVVIVGMFSSANDLGLENTLNDSTFVDTNSNEFNVSTESDLDSIAVSRDINECISKTEYVEEDGFAFGSITAITYDKLSKNFYVGDVNNKKIRRFNADGAEIYGNFPGEDHVFDNLIDSIVFDRIGNMYVSENIGNNRSDLNRSGTAWKFFVDGSKKEEKVNLDKIVVPALIATGPNSTLDTIFISNLYMSNSKGISILNQVNNLPDSPSDNSDNWNNSEKNFNGISGFATDAKGNLLVLDQTLGQVKFFEIVNGVKKSSKVFIDKTGPNATNLKVDSAGNVYFASGNPATKIKKYGPDGKFILDIPLNKSGSVSDMTIDSDGSIYILFSSGSKIVKYSPKWLCGKITIKKDTVPNSDTIFTFNKNFDKMSKSNSFYIKKNKTSTFTLSDSGAALSNSITFKMLENGKYIVSEKSNSVYKRTLKCTDPSQNTTLFPGNAQANISLDNDEEVICEFTNTVISLQNDEL